MRQLLLAILLAGALLPARAQAPQMQVNPNTGETPEQFAARTQWWRDARFGMFIHWGVYAVPADSTDLHGNKRIGEWYFSNKQMQMKDYEKFAAQFNPVKFDAHRWVKTAKDAGMKYIVITTKHHDGFDMFGTKLNRDWNIVDSTPWHKDPLKMLAAECKRQGIRLCFYHSIMDWHHPDYVPRRPWEKETRPADGADLNRYIQYMKGQITELLSNYGPVGILWFDGGWEHNAQELHSDEVNRMIRSLQPGIIINDRNHEPQDYTTPEQTIPATGYPGGRLWETCMTMNDTWGYAANDTDWKSTEDLIHKLCDIASKGGNFLLNVGPKPDGTFPDAINERLAQIGAWMKVNGRSIYSTTHSPFKRLPFDGRCTVKGSTLYLQVFHWPEGGLTLSGLQTPVESARALDGGEPLAVTSLQGPGGGEQVAGGRRQDSRRQEGGRGPLEIGLDTPGEGTVLHIAKPARIDPYATVVELKLAGPPVVTESVPAVKAGTDGSLTLAARDAEVHGSSAQYEVGNGKDNIGYWTNAQDYVTWAVEAPSGGRYAVEVTYACEPDAAGSTYTVGPEGGPSVSGTVASTGSWTDWKTMRLGEITLPAGRSILAVHVTRMPSGAAMNLKQVRLIPAGAAGTSP